MATTAQMPEHDYPSAMAQESPSRDQDKFMVRMPAGMRERIADVAKENNRSMNAEIVARLEASFSGVVLSKPSDVTPYLGNFLALLEESGMFEITPKGREYIKSKKGKEE